MSITAYVPGMKPGSTIRNAILAFCYVLLFPLFPFVLAYMAGTNHHGFADRIAGVPGVSEGGGVVSALVVFVVALVVVGMVGAVLPGEETPDAPEPGGENGGDDATEATENANETDGAEGENGDEGAAEAAEDVDEADEAESADEGDEAQEELEEEADDNDLSASEMALAFEIAAAENGLDVEGAEHIEGEFQVDYTSHAGDSEEELAGEIGGLAGGYAGVVENGHGGERMVVYGHTPNDELAFTFEVEAEWGASVEQRRDERRRVLREYPRDDRHV